MGDTDLTVGTGNLLTVENGTGSQLPSTGGMGTTIFYALGAALAIGAGVVLVTRKRLSK
jgi:LPXTG-motif cell wall-anchored protein